MLGSRRGCAGESRMRNATVFQGAETSVSASYFVLSNLQLGLTRTADCGTLCAETAPPEPLRSQHERYDHKRARARRRR